MGLDLERPVQLAWGRMVAQAVQHGQPGENHAATEERQQAAWYAREQAEQHELQVPRLLALLRTLYAGRWGMAPLTLLREMLGLAAKGSVQLQAKVGGQQLGLGERLRALDEPRAETRRPVQRARMVQAQKPGAACPSLVVEE